MADNTQQDQVSVEIEEVLAGFQTEIAKLTRRAILAETEAHTLRAQRRQHLARIADLEQQVSTDASPDAT